MTRRPRAGGLPRADRPERRWFPAFRGLLWQARREAKVAWLLLLGAALAALILNFAVVQGGWPQIFGVLAALVAGVSVFGNEGRAKTTRFLAHHGARPWQVWLAKVGTWAALVAIPTLVLVAAIEAPRPSASGQGAALWFLAAISTTFAVSLLCGMAIPRAIVAASLALVLAPLVMVPTFTLALAEMIPYASLALVPGILLLSSLGWAGDWMLDRGGPGRMVRFALWLFVPIGSLSLAYVGYRAWGLPEIPPPADLAAIRSATVPPPRTRPTCTAAPSR